VDWIRWLVREEAYFESESGCAAREALLYSSHSVHHNSLSFSQCSGSATFWYGSDADPDPQIRTSD
jgi:hypothetical protein